MIFSPFGSSTSFTSPIFLNEGRIDEMVRNRNNGWVFCRSNLDRIPDNESIAIQAVEAAGLDFGAVDIIRTPNRESIVLEINTAPGLEGETLVSYTNAIREHLNENRYSRSQWYTHQQGRH